MLAHSKSEYGFTLVEILVALVLNVIVMGALIAIFSNNVKYFRLSLDQARLDQGMQMAMDIMSDEIKRAGYYANASNDIGTGVNNNPFVASGTDISVNSTNDCILFSYDKDNNGILPAISSSYDDERYGFRLSGQVLQTRPSGALFSCAASSSSWEDMTDSNIIQITALTFTLNSKSVTTGPGAKGIIFRSVDVTMSGQLTSDSTVTKTLTEHIKIRNDKYIP